MGCQNLENAPMTFVDRIFLLFSFIFFLLPVVKSIGVGFLRHVRCLGILSCGVHLYNEAETG